MAKLWTTRFEGIDPAARFKAVGLLNTIGTGAAPAVPLMAYLTDQQILEIGQSVATLSILARAIVLLLLLNVMIFLCHDYRGPLSEASSQTT